MTKLAKQIETLEASIVKWENIVSRGTDDIGCACCVEYYDIDRDDGRYCEGCPIFEDTGKCGCSGTPYTAWILRYEANEICGHNQLEDKEVRELAVTELNYLKGLLERLKGG